MDCAKARIVLCQGFQSPNDTPLYTGSLLSSWGHFGNMTSQHRRVYRMEYRRRPNVFVCLCIFVEPVRAHSSVRTHRCVAACLPTWMRVVLRTWWWTCVCAHYACGCVRAYVVNCLCILVSWSCTQHACVVLIRYVVIEIALSRNWAIYTVASELCSVKWWTE